MRAVIALLVASALLAGCGGSSLSEPTPPPAQSSGINFTNFTLQLLRSQSDTAQPLQVRSAQFEFPDDDNPQAFAAVLPAI